MADWYSNSDWNEAIEAQFFARLERAKSQRDQYLVIQALHLANGHPEVALRLVELYFDTRSDDFHDDRARRAEAAAHFALGGHVAALDAYLAALTSDHAAAGSLVVASPLEFAFLAARYRSSNHYDAAIGQLAAVPIPAANQFDGLFRYYAANALLMTLTGRDPAGAQRQAALALALPEAVLAAYPDLGWRLRGITRS